MIHKVRGEITISSVQDVKADVNEIPRRYYPFRSPSQFDDLADTMDFKQVEQIRII